MWRYYLFDYVIVFFNAMLKNISLVRQWAVCYVWGKLEYTK